MYDFILRKGTIVDGSGKKAFVGDIGITGSEIAGISPHLEAGAKREINVEGLMVAPGFIDVHTHDDIVFDADPCNLPKLTQGVTTVVVGNCGFGVAPYTPAHKKLLADYSAPIIGSDVEQYLQAGFTGYMAHMEELPKAMNVAALVPHGSISISLNGFSVQPLAKGHLREAERLVCEAMDAGALGMSLGLMYTPGCYAGENELRHLVKAVGKSGGMVCVHMKSESNHFRESIAAAAQLSKDCNVPVEISHLKHVGRAYWGHMQESLRYLEQEMAGGADLSFDMYPYTMGSTTMSILFPTRLLQQGVGTLVSQLGQQAVRDSLTAALDEEWGDEDNLSKLCGWENVIISSVASEKNIACLGKSIRQIAQERGSSDADAFMDLFVEEGGDVAILLNHIKEQDMVDTILFPHLIPASDGIPGAKTPHPRLYGTFPRYLRTFVRQRQLLTWEEAIRKITGMPAKRFRLGRRGELRPGFTADITVFDPDTITDTATYSQPRSYAQGIHHVLAGGVPVLENGVPGKARPGKLIRRA